MAYLLDAFHELLNSVANFCVVCNLTLKCHSLTNLFRTQKKRTMKRTRAFVDDSSDEENERMTRGTGISYYSTDEVIDVEKDKRSGDDKEETISERKEKKDENNTDEDKEEQDEEELEEDSNDGKEWMSEGEAEWFGIMDNDLYSEGKNGWFSKDEMVDMEEGVGEDERDVTEEGKMPEAGDGTAATIAGEAAAGEAAAKDVDDGKVVGHSAAEDMEGAAVGGEAAAAGDVGEASEDAEEAAAKKMPVIMSL